MKQHNTAISITVLMLLAVLCSASSAWSSLPWGTRQGTIASAKMLPDGSYVYLDAENVVKIKAQESDPYFLIAEPFEQGTRLVVLTPPSPELRLGQTVDIEGTITTLEDGLTRAIIGATVWGYTDAEGKLLCHGPLIKGLLERTPWQWMVNLTVGIEAIDAPAVVSEAPNVDPAPAPSFYPEIADIIVPSSDQGASIQSYYNGIPDLQGLPDESLVELQCKRITAVGTEDINGITYSYMDISEDPPLTDTIRAYYTGTASTTDRINRISGQIRHVNTIPVICVNTGPGYNPQILEGSCQLAAQGTIAWAKTFPDGTQLPAGLVAKIVSVDFTYYLHYLYIQEQNRASGIRIIALNDFWAPRGDRVTITTGQVTTVDNERALAVLPANFSRLNSGTIAPVGMNNKMVAGGPFNTFTPGATGAFGLNNVGLLVKTWGRVSDVQPSYFYINDGSDDIGVKVDLNDGPNNLPHSLQNGDYGAVTGVVRLENVNGQLRRVIKPEWYTDIQAIQVIPHFTGITASPVAATPGTVVTITFSVDTGLSANPTVTVNGNSATYGSSSGYDYTYQYTIQESDNIGWATILVSGTNTSGVSGSASSSTTLLISAIGFDNNGNRTLTLDSRGVTDYEYDVLGRLTKATEPDGKWIAYEYDLNNNRTEMTVHLSDSPLVEHVTQYEYNDRNLLWHVTDQLSGVTTYTYYDNGLVDTITYPNGTKTVHTYNNR
ncbi:MAG: RHS repeat domain-containing protein, partial [Armatimonadota bacterium]